MRFLLHRQLHPFTPENSGRTELELETWELNTKKKKKRSITMFVFREQVKNSIIRAHL